MLRIGFRSALVIALLLPGAHVRAQGISLALEAIAHPLFAAEGLRLTLTDPSGGPADLVIGRLRFGAHRYERLRIHCDDLRLSGESVICPKGVLTADTKRLALSFSYHPRSQALELGVEPQRGERWRITMRGAGGARHIELALEHARVERVADWFPPALAAYAPKGAVSGVATWQGDALAADILANGMAFANPRGTRAADRLAASLSLRARLAHGAWQWQGEARLDAGEIYWQPFYFASGGHRLSATGTLDAAALEVSRGELELAGIGRVDFSGVWDRSAGVLRAAQFETGALDLKQGAALILAPLLEQAQLPKFEFAGSASLAAALDAQGLARVDLALRNASLAEADRRYALRGVEATIPWRREAATEGEVHVAGADFGRVPLGAFVLPVRLQGQTLMLPRAEIPVLDGKLILEDLRIARQGGAWQWQLGGSLEPVSMQLLTGVLGVPRMSGAMSAFIPKIRYADSTIDMDGALIIQAFDGYVAARNLRVIEPMGRVPRLSADLEARHLDLGMLTQTYSFGSVTGYVDADVSGLELADWRPQRFAARVASSPGDYAKRISQRAVQNISSLGGAGAGAAIERSFLGVFEQFGYDRLGLSCTLADGVCAMGGVENAPNGYVIVKGGGVPALSVIGYNRRVDWDELVARIRRVAAGNARPIVR